MYPGQKVKMKMLFQVVCQGSLLGVFLQGKQVAHHTLKHVVYKLLRVFWEQLSADLYCSLAKKGPWAVHITLCLDKGVGGYL